MAFQGSLKELPLPDIIQLVSVSGKTGMFSLSGDYSEGEIFLRDGQIVHARTGKLEGEEAVFEMAIWQEGEFVFQAGEVAPKVTVRKSNTNLLMEAARRIDEWKVLAKRIPSTAVVPVFSPQATTTSVSLTPQEWSLISKIDERRSIDEIAIGLGMSPFDACKLLYGLITSELISLQERLDGLVPEQLAEASLEELRDLASEIEDKARQIMAGYDREADLDRIHALWRTELEAGRAVDAVLDEVRALEKLVTAARGPNQSRAFLDQVSSMMSAA